MRKKSDVKERKKKWREREREIVKNKNKEKNCAKNLRLRCHGRLQASDSERFSTKMSHRPLIDGINVILT
jgi:hypothetical protein